ncbi:MAG: NfeD family protein [Nitrospirales bacterium]
MWDATCDQPVPAGTEVRVTAIDGLKLRVTAATQKGEARV